MAKNKDTQELGSPYLATPYGGPGDPGGFAMDAVTAPPQVVKPVEDPTVTYKYTPPREALVPEFQLGDVDEESPLRAELSKRISDFEDAMYNFRAAGIDPTRPNAKDARSLEAARYFANEKRKIVDLAKALERSKANKEAYLKGVASGDLTMNPELLRQNYFSDTLRGQLTSEERYKKEVDRFNAMNQALLAKKAEPHEFLALQKERQRVLGQLANNAFLEGNPNMLAYEGQERMLSYPFSTPTQEIGTDQTHTTTTTEASTSTTDHQIDPSMVGSGKGSGGIAADLNKLSRFLVGAQGGSDGFMVVDLAGKKISGETMYVGTYGGGRGEKGDDVYIIRSKNPNASKDSDPHTYYRVSVDPEGNKRVVPISLGGRSLSAFIKAAYPPNHSFNKESNSPEMRYIRSGADPWKYLSDNDEEFRRGSVAFQESNTLRSESLSQGAVANVFGPDGLKGLSDKGLKRIRGFIQTYDYPRVYAALEQLKTKNPNASPDAVVNMLSRSMVDGLQLPEGMIIPPPEWYGGFDGRRRKEESVKNTNANPPVSQQDATKTTKPNNVNPPSNIKLPDGHTYFKMHPTLNIPITESGGKYFTYNPKTGKITPIKIVDSRK
jgi:hypothetical protein